MSKELVKQEVEDNMDSDDNEVVDDDGDHNKKMRAFKKLPSQHNRGLASTLMRLFESGELQSKEQDSPSPVQPEKSKDGSRKDLASAKEGTIRESIIPEYGIPSSVLNEEADVEIEYENLSPDELGGEKSEFYCKMCEVQTTSLKNFADHLSGKSHKSMLEAGKSGKKKVPRGKKNTSLPLGEPGEKSACLEMIKDSTDVILGLSSITEYHSIKGVTCICNLCAVKFDKRSLLSHVIGSKHRLRYLKDHRYQDYQRVKQFSGKKSRTSFFLEELSSKIEREDGHGYPVIKVFQPDERMDNKDTENETEEHWKALIGPEEPEGLEAKLKILTNKEDAETLAFSKWINEELKRAMEIYEEKKRNRKSEEQKKSSEIQQSDRPQSSYTVPETQDRNDRMGFGSHLSKYSSIQNLSPPLSEPLNWASRSYTHGIRIETHHNPDPSERFVSSTNLHSIHSTNRSHRIESEIDPDPLKRFLPRVEQITNRDIPSYHSIKTSMLNFDPLNRLIPRVEQIFNHETRSYHKADLDPDPVRRLEKLASHLSCNRDVPIKQTIFDYGHGQGDTNGDIDPPNFSRDINLAPLAGNINRGVYNSSSGEVRDRDLDNLTLEKSIVNDKDLVPPVRSTTRNRGDRSLTPPARTNRDSSPVLSRRTDRDVSPILSRQRDRDISPISSRRAEREFHHSTSARRIDRNASPVSTRRTERDLNHLLSARRIGRSRGQDTSTRTDRDVEISPIPSRRTDRDVSPILSRRTNRDLSPVSSRRRDRDVSPKPSRRACRGVSPVPSRRIDRNESPISLRKIDRDLSHSSSSKRINGSGGQGTSTSRTDRDESLVSSRRTGRDVSPILSRRTERDVSPISSRRTDRDVSPISSWRTDRDVSPIPSRRTYRDVSPFPPRRTDTDRSHSLSQRNIDRGGDNGTATRRRNRELSPVHSFHRTGRDLGHSTSARKTDRDVGHNPSARSITNQWEDDIQQLLECGRKLASSDSLTRARKDCPEISPSPPRNMKITKELAQLGTHLEIALSENKQRMGYCDNNAMGLFSVNNSQEYLHKPHSSDSRRRSKPETSSSQYPKNIDPRFSHNPSRSNSPEFRMSRKRTIEHCSFADSPNSYGNEREYASTNTDRTKPVLTDRWRSEGPRRSSQSGSRSPESRSPMITSMSTKQHPKRLRSPKQRKSPRHSPSPKRVSKKPYLLTKMNEEFEFQEVQAQNDNDDEAERIANLLLQISSSMTGKEDPQAALQTLFSNSELTAALLATKNKMESDKSHDIKHTAKRHSRSPEKFSRSARISGKSARYSK